MVSGVALIMFAAAQASGPAEPQPPAPPAEQNAAAAADGCGDATTTGNQREITICAQRPNGYRLNSDVMEAKREKRSGGGGAKGPNTYNYPTCSTVGPAGCFNAGINLVAAALTAAEMAKRLAEGKEIGSMFKTGHEKTEYELYLEAKKNREAREAEAALVAKAKAKAAIPAPSAPAQP